MGTFDDAVSTLYSTITPTGTALDNSSRRRKSMVGNMSGFIERLQLDLSGLSVIHVTGTKGKGSTCAMAESILRRCGFTTGLFTSPHLLDVRERIRLNGKPLAKEAFAENFFQVWDRLKTTRPVAAGDGEGQGGRATRVELGSEVVEMPAYFSLLTLLGLWCFVRERVDVCIVEVGMGGRFDATNVLLPPVACGVSMLDLDHTQILGDTLEKIAWEKGGIFKAGCEAFTVEQPQDGMSVLRQCAEDAGCSLQVVSGLPAHDAAGVPYEIGLAGDHQRTNAALAMNLCMAWIRGRKLGSSRGNVRACPGYAPDGPHGTAKPRPEAVQGERGMTRSGPNGGQPVLESTEAFFASNAVHRGLSECTWPGRCQVFRPRSHPGIVFYLDGAHTGQSVQACLRWFKEKTGKVAHPESAGEPEGCLEDTGDAEARCRLVGRGAQRRVRRVLWFYASHERDVVSLLEPLVSAQIGDVDAFQAENPSTGAPGSQENLSLSDDEGHLPFFDEAWFMEIKQVRPSRFAPPTAREILRSHGMDAQGVSEGSGRTQSADPPRVTVEPDEASGRSQGAESTAGWQRTLEQLWIVLQARAGFHGTVTGTGTVGELVRYLERLSPQALAGGGSVADVAGDTEGPVPDETAAGTSIARVQGSEREAFGAPGGPSRVEVLCTGSLFVVAAVLEAFGAEIP